MVAAWARHNCNGGAKKFEVVYVSSDKTEDQMLTSGPPPPPRTPLGIQISAAQIR